MQHDARINALEGEIDVLTVRVLALRQPMAQDLREVVAALKISSDIERIGDYAANVAKRTLRSEEHTSELQSLMRISYAVFCLKKKNKNKFKPTQTYDTINK